MPPEITSPRRERPSPNTGQHQHITTRVLLAAGVVGPVLFVVTFTVAGWLRPGYSAMASAVSDLGVGNLARIQNANFLLFGALLIAFAVGFRRVMSELIGGHSTWGAIMIATTGIGMLGAVLFPAAPPTEMLHFLLGFLVVIVSAVTAAFYLGRQFRRVPGWRSLSRYSTWTGLTAVALVLLTFRRAQLRLTLGGSRNRRPDQPDTRGRDLRLVHRDRMVAVATRQPRPGRRSDQSRLRAVSDRRR